MDLPEDALLTKITKKTVECGQLLPQEVRMWQKFAELARVIDNADDSSSWSSQEANNFAQMSLQNQRIMDALMASIEANGQSIEL